jgi:hypothetical protein
MSVTKVTVFIGIMCSVRMASPLTANAFDLKEFVGLSDRGSTKVKTCFEDDDNRKGGRTSFSNKAASDNKAASGVRLIIDLADGNGLNGDDDFDAFFDYGAAGGAAAVPFAGVSVPATASWVDTEIAIDSGDALAISATGSASPNGVNNFNGPDGDDCGTCIAPVPNSRYALVGRIGVAGASFLVGSNYSGTASDSGSLFLAFNDDFHADNGGSFLASGSVTAGGFVSVSQNPLFSGVWSKIDKRMKGDKIFRETYQLTPSGDLASFPPSGGWNDLLDLISAEVGNACLKAPPIQVYGDLSDFVKGTLVVENKDPKCATTTDDKKKAYNAACLSECAGGSCMKARVKLDVKAFMNDDDTNTAAEVKTDWVRFRYKATGYVVGSNPP